MKAGDAKGSLVPLAPGGDFAGEKDIDFQSERHDGPARSIFARWNQLRRENRFRTIRRGGFGRDGASASAVLAGY